MTWKDDIYTCPVCHTEDGVPPYGRKDAPVLMVAEFPGISEIKAGIPFVGRMGTILKTELARVGFDLKSARRANLWQHVANKNEDCLNVGIETIVKEAKGRKLVVLFGSDTVKILTGYSVSTVSGLQLKSNYFSAPVLACVNPATVFHDSIGELRFGIQQFIKVYEEIMK